MKIGRRHFVCVQVAASTRRRPRVLKKRRPVGVRAVRVVKSSRLALLSLSLAAAARVSVEPLSWLAADLERPSVAVAATAAESETID